MAAYRGAMHVARNKRGYVTKSGEERVYETILLGKPSSRVPENP